MGLRRRGPADHRRREAQLEAGEHFVLVDGVSSTQAGEFVLSAEALPSP
jgi:hypothetical protein